MVEVEFMFNGTKTTIQCNLEDKMKDIIKKYSSKFNKNIKDFFFLYGGNKVNEESTLDEQINKLDKERKK